MKAGWLPRVTTLLVLVFFYLPILILVLGSFNTSRTIGVRGDFTLQWYVRLVRDRNVMEALSTSLQIGAVVTLLSTVLGTVAALALHRFRTRMQRIHYGLVYAPVVVPDVLMGISLLLFFASVGFRLGRASIVLAHVTFCLSYVALVVLARLQEFDETLMEAAYDLGATRTQAVVRVLLPLLGPGILAGALLAFTISLDDFVITFFVAGPGATTLPISVYSMIRYGRPPVIYALSTVLIALTFVSVWMVQRATQRRTPA